MAIVEGLAVAWVTMWEVVVPEVMEGRVPIVRAIIPVTSSIKAEKMVVRHRTSIKIVE